MASVKVTIESTRETDALLLSLPIAVREKYLKLGLKAAGRIVRDEAKRRCPKGKQRTGKKEGKKHLRDTIRSEFRDYGRKKVQVIGPEYPAGAHGHLVEFGHAEVLWGKPTGRRVPPKPFMRPAVDSTKQQQIDALNNAVRAGIEKEANVA
jgi:HK97 gp10 family phage protein